ncbi:MAG: AAA family ATPase, partial [Bacteroidota bacterium]
EFSIKDLATNKEKYLKAVIEELKRRGFFKVNSPVKLYDNVLVGRKRTHPRKANATSTAPPSVEPDATHEDYDHYQEYVDLLQFNPNLILYGPPGTGKTFSVEKIIEAFEYDRTEEETTFQELTEQGRVRFVTFHQSFSYEEFVEGLRPMTNDNESGQSHGLKYEVKPGILRQMANKAVISQLQEDFEGNQLQHIGESSTVWKVSLGSRGKEEEVYKDCIQSNTIAIGWLPGEDLHNWSKQDIYQALEKENTNGSDRPTNDSDTIYKFVNEIQIGDVVLVFASVNSIRAIGVVTGAYYRDETKPNYYFHRRKVSWLKIFDQPFEILKYNDNVRLTLKTVYKLTRIEFSDIKEMLQIDEAENKKPKSAALPHFLIIDEINRGNISKIFGELITLIEKDKRDKIKVQLPYSQSTFSLPANLYIIGTMNTADRSIALLDTALRRRFAFKELEPDVEVIKNNDPFVDDDIDLALLLERLNEQITQKIDRDHRIGHAYFLDVYHLKQLKLIWYYQILPLLMEYFYNDGKAIASIVTSNFIDENSAQIKWIEHDERFKQAIVNVQNQKL